MNTITLQAEIQEVDFPLIEKLLKRLKAKTKIIEKGKTTSVTNATTIKAMEEAQKLMNDKNTEFFTDLDDFLHYLKN